ncbi:MAG: coagulation factor 5/8 type protein [Phenylobacterium sp.]|nr:coagulation factor 5/8 type protein [Phenylobacterium sp.]
MILLFGLAAALFAGAGPIAAAERPACTPATVAALPPEVTAGRGARPPFVEYEAENGLTNGKVIGPDRTFGALASEASGRRAVRLEGVGGFVDVVLCRPANAVTLRYALPDSADGKGLTAAIALWADGQRLGRLALTSRYGWFYGRYPFTNDPRDGKPHHFYDEARLRLGRTLAAGTRVRFLVEAQDGAAWRLLDLADFEVVGPPLPRPAKALSIRRFGADPSGARDSAGAIAAAVAAGRASGRPVWIDPGRYRVERHIVVDRVTLAGAGPWYSVLAGDGVGVFGRRTRGGSRNVVLRDFSILGEVGARNDHARLAGVGGAMSDSTVSNLWIQHTKGGVWFDGPMARITVTGLRILDQAADGVNFHRGVTDAVVQDSFVRNSGDDGLAVWSHRIADQRITFRRNTVIAPILANGIAAYGGRDIRITDNLVADTVTEGGGFHLGARFNATPFQGRIELSRDTAVRAGVLDVNWRRGVGALWLYALDRPIAEADIRIEDVDLIDSAYEAVQFTGKAISGVAFDRIRIDGAGTYGLQLDGPGGASFAHVTARNLGLGGVHDCRSGFTIVRGSGDEGWDDTACPAADRPR